MISVDAALAAYRQLAPLPVETLAVTAALHRVLAADALATWDLPRHSQSALDGYVLCAEDAAQPGSPLVVAGTVAAGDILAIPPLSPGVAQRIFTGARVPPNASPSNAVVVAQERCQRSGEAVSLQAALKPGANIRWQGEEARAGSVVARSGQRLSPGLIASLVSAGVAEVQLRCAPRITVLVSGDELKPAGSALADGQIWDSNGPLVLAWLQQQGYAATQHYLPDTLAATRAAIAAALATSDVVITTGGVSVGDKDFIIPAAESLGVQRQFWQVAQKPGKPLYFGLSPLAPTPTLPRFTGEGEAPGACWAGEGSSVALLGLPGNPGAVLVGLALHVRLLLEVLQGQQPPGAAFAPGQLVHAVKADAQRERLLRMQLAFSPSGQALLQPLPYQDSHMLTNLDTATVLVRVPAREQAFVAGDVLQWMRL